MYQRLLVPVDGSELSDRAMARSIQLAKQLGAAVIGFVAEPLIKPVSGPREEALLEEEAKGHDAMTEAHARQVLAGFEARAGEAGVPFEGHYDRNDDVAAAIAAAAASQGWVVQASTSKPHAINDPPASARPFSPSSASHRFASWLYNKPPSP